MRVHLAYGRTGLEVEIPDRNLVKTLGYRSAAPLADSDRAVREALAQPVGAAPLAQLARGRRDACVVICDITRPVPNEALLRPLLETLHTAGIPREKTLILVATGLHRPSTPDERIEMVGRSIVEQYRIEDHRGEAVDEHVYLGESPRGVPIWIDRRYVEADLKITTGLIEPHFMAGFSGGRKLVCPGLAALPTIRAWHSPRFLEHPAARSGSIDGNPVHEENTWIARRAGCDFIVNVVIDAGRQILRVVAGDMEAALAEGITTVRSLVCDTVPAPVDIVVTSSAGYPLDATYYQCVKGMVAAMEIVKPGGTIILAASLSEGIGSEPFQRIFRENASLEQFMARITTGDYFVMDQWQVEELARVSRKAKVVVVSDGLPQDMLRGMFVDASPSVEAALSAALAEHGPDATVAVIPEGPYVIAEVAPT